MNLELLANELLIEVFDYLYSVELLRSFHGLNQRLNDLIDNYFRKHRLDFRRSTKKDFDEICQKTLRLISNEILSIGLSDDDEIPSQISLFHSSGWRLNHFSNLRSLTFDHIRQSELINEILPECSSIIHLNLTSCFFQCSESGIRRLMNTIWNLPSLIYCYLSFILKIESHVPLPTNISSTIEHLTIIGAWIYPNQLGNLSECTPRLRFLAFDYAAAYGRNDEGLQTIIPSLKELNLSYVGVESNILENILQNLPNLTRLKIESCYLEMDGYQWENLIRNSLPKLEEFQLKIKLSIHGEKKKKDFFKSFQTSFWIEEHRWFIQYYFNFHQTSDLITLHTLPYNFTKLDLAFPLQIHSTYSQNQFDYSYENVQYLFYRSTADEQTNLLSFKLPNVTHLSVTLPINNQFLGFLNQFQKLFSLEISKPKTMSNEDAQTQLQTILDQTSFIYSLKFQSWPSLNQPFIPFNLQSSSIRRFNLRGYDYSFTEEDLILRNQSMFQIYCEILIIKVKNRFNVLYLINSLPNLRSLIVRTDDDNGRGYGSSTDDPFIQWFKDNLPSTCSIQRDLRYIQYIRIWIHL